MIINAMTLPPAQEIDQPQIAKAAEHYATAQKALAAAQHQLRSAWQDRDDAEAAAKEGRPAPRGSLVEHVQKVDALQKDVAAAIDATVKTGNALQGACDRHGDEWAKEYERRSEALDEQWESTVAELVELHAERAAVNRRRRVFGVEPISASVLKFKPGQVYDDITGDKVELAFDGNPDTRRRRLIGIRLDDALDALATLGQPIELEPAPAYGIADQFVAAAKHARTVARGYSVEEAQVGNGLNVGGVPFFNPSAEQPESD